MYGINGGYDHTVVKAALTLLFGSIALMLGTASRYRWPQVNACAPMVTVVAGMAAAKAHF